MRHPINPFGWYRLSWTVMLVGCLASGSRGQPASRPSTGDLLQRRCQLAYVLLWSKDFPAAEKEFRKVLDADTNHDEARIGLALAMERKALVSQPVGDFAAAATEFARIQPRSPHYAAAMGGLARILTAQKKLKDAIHVYQELKKQSLLTDEYRLAYVETLAWDGQYEPALAELAPLSKRPKVPPEIAKIEGQILAWSGRSEEALPKLREALAAAPHDDNLRLDLAAALLRSQKQDEAADIMKDMSAKAAGTVKTIGLRADILTAQKKYEEAIALVRQSLQGYPDDEGLSVRLAQLLSWTHQLDEAIRIYRTLCDRKPDNQELRTRLAETLSWAGRFDEAAIEFRRALGEAEK